MLLGNKGMLFPNKGMLFAASFLPNVVEMVELIP